MGLLCCHGERSDKHASDELAEASASRGPLVRIIMMGLGSADTMTIVRQLHLLASKNGMYRMCDEDWNTVDSKQTELRIRNPTVDMHRYRFQVHQTRIEISDVGGDRFELMKIDDHLRQWSHSLEAAQNFILLVVSMADYNKEREEHEGTLLDECVEHMKVLLNNKAAQNCGLIIFFDKDGFKEKLADQECKEDFSYLAPFVDAKTVTKYLNEGTFDELKMSKAIANKFAEALKEVKNRRKSAYSRYTCAEDTKMMEAIYSAAKGDLVQDAERAPTEWNH